MLRRMLKILAWTGGLCVLLAAAGLYALDRYLGAEDFKHRLERLFTQATGYVLEVHEELGVTLYPWLGVKAEGVVLRQAVGGEALAAASQVSVAVDLLDLIRQHLNVKTLSLHQLEVNVHFDAQGRSGWEGLWDMAGALAPDGAVSDVRSSPPLDFQIHSLQLSDSIFRYSDDRVGQLLSITGVDLRTGAYGPRLRRPVTVEVSGRVNLCQPAVAAEVRFMGGVRADWSKGTVKTEGAVLDVQLTGLPGRSSAPLRAACRLSLDTETARARLEEVHAAWAGLALDGAFDASSIFDHPRVAGRVALEPFAVREVLNAIFRGLIPEKDPDSFGLGRISAEVNATLDRVEVTHLYAEMDESRLTGCLAVVPGGVPAVSWDLNLDQIDFDRYYAVFTTPEDFYLQDFFPDLPRSALLSGRLQVGRMTLAGSDVEHADLRLESGAGVFRLELPQADLAGGTVAAALEAQVDREGEDYSLALDGGLHCTGIPAANLPFGTGPGWALSGRGDVDIDVQMPRTPFAPTRIIDDVLRLVRLKADYRLRSGALATVRGDAKAGRTVVRYRRCNLNATLRGTGQGGGHDDFGFDAGAVLTLDAAPDGYALNAKLGGRLGLDFPLERLCLTGTNLGVQYKGRGLPDADAIAVFSADADLNLSAARLALANISAEVTGVKVGGKLLGENLFSDKRTVAGQLTASAADLAAVLRIWGVDPGAPRDPSSYRSPRLRAKVALRGRDLELDRVEGGLDDFIVRGTARLADYGRGRITFDLKGGNLDADRFRPNPPPVEDAPALKGNDCMSNRQPPRPLPLGLLRSLDLHGAFTLKGLHFFDLWYHAVSGTLDASGGRIVLEPCTSEFYGGSLDAGLVLKVKTKALEMNLDLMADDFQAGDFLRDKWGRDYVRGASDLTMDFTACGATDEDLLNTLTGTTGFTVRDGSYRFQGGEPASAREPRSRFHLARASFAAKNGRLNVTNFLLDSTLMHGTGGGYLDVAQNLIDLKIDAKYVSALAVPIRIQGCLSDPDVSVPGDKMLENTVKEIISIPLKPFQYLQRLIF